MMIYMIEFMIYKYYSKIAKYIKLSFRKKILIDILL